MSLGKSNGGEPGLTETPAFRTLPGSPEKTPMPFLSVRWASALGMILAWALIAGADVLRAEVGRGERPVGAP
eukprot:CAMPEP_0171271972 /NCGR_PEP_ID=MMETSP0790-20130122/61510_1 /TAXON_ID=2925 /ORGANISM="Alexandrium catenella, Strain OF101" /LENGTH=71 /DNA_ID=CAMNT_0011740877 /DNA_START=94 /DNA_END=308 /DNA_ORIENTATION=+